MEGRKEAEDRREIKSPIKNGEYESRTERTENRETHRPKGCDREFSVIYAWHSTFVYARIET